jgi:antitoxin component YwqK of YwqJK toxin-antitoxin module
MIFKGQPGKTIFTCKILTVKIPTYENGITMDRTIGTSTALVMHVYFGTVDTTIVTLNYEYTVGRTYLIYGSGDGKTFGCGGVCDNWTKEVDDYPNSTYDLVLLKQFSDIFTQKKSGNFSFKNAEGLVVAEGSYRKGKPVNIWKHYYDNRVIKAIYDVKKNSTSQYFINGFIKEKITLKGNTTMVEQYSGTINMRLEHKFSETKIGNMVVFQSYDYYANGNLKSISGSFTTDTSNGKTGKYEEYYENGNLKLKGQYDQDKRIGIWKWYNENGHFNTEFDYKDGMRSE